MLDGFEISHTWDGFEILGCLNCGDDVNVNVFSDGSTLRAYVAAAKAHTHDCKNGGTR